MILFPFKYNITIIDISLEHMHKNLLILGGYNWFGFEIIDALIRENSFTHFIIVDCFENQLWKDSIKHKMDQYMYLYESDIFLYNYNIKDKNKIKELYEHHKITHVINNIKYNMKDQHIMEKIDGFEHIYECNATYHIQKYICLYRYISHNTFCFNHDPQDYVATCNDFNHCAHTIHTESSPTPLEEIRITDYVYGDKKDKYNEIISKYKNIIQSGAPCYIDRNPFYIQKDDDIIQKVLSLLLELNSTTGIVTYKYSYQELVETIQYHMGKGPKTTRMICDNPSLVEYIQTN